MKEIAPAHLDFMRVTPSKHNRDLPPNWRWERARWLLSKGKNIRKSQEDPWVVLAYRFQKDIDKIDDDQTAYRLFNKYGGLFKAWQWYTAPESGRNARWTIEAYLCAGENLARIADRVDNSPESVGCYAKLFYDVLGKQKHLAYMLNVAIGGHIHFGLSEREYDILWKLMGLARGPIYLDGVLSKISDPGHINSVNQISEVSHGMLKDASLLKSLYAIHTIPIAYNQEIIFAFYNKLVEIEKKAETPGQAQNLIQANINSTFTCLQISVGRPERDPQSVDANRLAYYDGHNAELRAHEQVALALGVEPTAKDKLSTLSFPEATDGEKQGS